MKPRLVSLPLTSEDVMIWRRWRRNIGDPWYGRLRIEYGAADIRDADLMLHLAELRASGDCYLRLKIGVHWCNVIVPAVQVYVRKNPFWPGEPDPT